MRPEERVDPLALLRIGRRLVTPYRPSLDEPPSDPDQHAQLRVALLEAVGEVLPELAEILERANLHLWADPSGFVGLQLPGREHFLGLEAVGRAFASHLLTAGVLRMPVPEVLPMQAAEGVH